VIATTVVRHAALSGPTGQVFEIDWSTRDIVHRMPVPSPQSAVSDFNPRGGMRGGRGVRVWDDRVYVANFDTVSVYDRRWRQVARLSDPWAVDIHEIDVGPGGIWLSCSILDLVLRLDHDGRRLDQWHLSDSPQLARRLGLKSKPIDSATDFRREAPAVGRDGVHLNSVQAVDDEHLVLNFGRVLPQRLVPRVLDRLMLLSRRSDNPSALTRLLCGRRDCIVRLDLRQRQRPEVLFDVPTFRPSHNGGLLPDGTGVLCHERGELLRWRLRRRPDRIPLPGVWWRGLAALSPRTLLIGTQPCGLLEVDVEEGRVTGSLTLPAEASESIHGLTVLPEAGRSAPSLL
jgi:hypothetical protein